MSFDKLSYHKGDALSLPKGWEIKKLGEIASFSQGIQVGLEHHLTEPKEGYVRFIRIVDYTQNTDDIRYIPNPGEKYFVNEEDIVMVRYGTPGLIGRGKAGVIANNLFKIKIERKDLTNDYLTLFLSQEHIQNYLGTQGSATMPALNFGQLKTVEVKFPPLPEQQRIVAILDEAFAAIDQAITNIEKNIENAKELFDSKKEELFEKLSRNSELMPINKVCEKMFAGGDKPKPNFSKVETEEYKIPVISNGEKNNGLFGYTNEPKVVKPSITISARGTIGFTVYRDYPFVPIVRLIVLTPNLYIVEPEYLMHAVKSLDILKSGSSIPQLTVPMMKGYSLPIPDKTKQQEVIELLNSLESKLHTYKFNLALKLNELEELKKSILQKAFVGELIQNATYVGI